MLIELGNYCTIVEKRNGQSFITTRDKKEHLVTIKVTGRKPYWKKYGGFWRRARITMGGETKPCWVRGQ